MTTAAIGGWRPLPLYLGGQAAWFAGVGVQMVLFPWLVAVALQQPANLVGIAQMATLAPTLALILVGGSTADRSDLRRLLIACHMLAALASLALAGLIATGHLAYGLLIGYGAAMGAFSAFAIPAREALLNRVADDRLPRAVALSTMTQFLGQLAGMALAGSAGVIGAPGLMVVQSAILLAGAGMVARLAPAPPLAAPDGSRWRELREGFAAGFGSARLATVLISILAVGVCYVGSYLVVLPLMVRDVYAGGAVALATVTVVFWAGTILAIAAILWRGGIARPGRALLAVMGAGVPVMAAMAVEAPFWAFAAICFVWGAGGGVVMTMGRTIILTEAPERCRARIVALYQLGLLGGAPVGALAMGFIIEAAGVRLAPLAPAAAMVGVVAALAAFTPLWRYRPTPPDHAGAVPGAAVRRGVR